MKPSSKSLLPTRVSGSRAKGWQELNAPVSRYQLDFLMETKLIFDFEREALPDGTMYDMCIVGSGPAGLTLAHELVRRGKHVLLLEGGGRSRWERRSQALNSTDIIGVDFQGAACGRFRALGGSSSAWAGQVIELDDHDFLARDWARDGAWPFTKTDLQDFYRRAAKLEGLNDQTDEDVRQRLGDARANLGDNLELSFSRFCPEKNFVTHFAATIDDERLTVVLHANVVELIPDKTGKAIASLRVRTLSGREAVCPVQLVVLALGGLESSRFLLNQNFAPWNASGLVGRHFQDHVHCFAAEVRHADLRSLNWPYGPFHLFGSYLPKIKLSIAAQRTHRLLNACGMVEYADGVHPTLRTAIKLWVGPTSDLRAKEIIQFIPRAPGVAWHRYRQKTNPDYVLPWAQPMLSVFCEQEPLSKSRLQLADKTDGLGLRKAKLNWDISESELRTIRKYVEFVQSVFAEKKIAEIVPDRRLLSDGILKKCGDTFHHCGGTRISADRYFGVVDPDLRLHGVKNAYLCSSSVFPSSGFANPTHTVIALAIRLSDHLCNLPQQRQGNVFKTTAPETRIRTSVSGLAACPTDRTKRYS